MNYLDRPAARALREHLEKHAQADRERNKATLALVRRNLVIYGVYNSKGSKVQATVPTKEDDE